MKIINLKAANVKKLIAIEIDAQGNHVVLSGNNGSGKTSTLDSIWAALQFGKANKVIEHPVRNGEEGAIAQIELDDYTITRKWTGERSTITVLDKEGNKLSSPQQILDGLIGNLAFDPLEFSTMKDLERSKVMMNLAHLDLKEVNQKYKELYDSRTGTNRVLKELAAASKQLTKPEDDWLDEEVSIENLLTERKAYDESVLAAGAHERDLLSKKNQLSEIETTIEQKVAELSELDNQKQRTVSSIESIMGSTPPRWEGKPLEELVSSMANVELINQRVRCKKLYQAKKEEYQLVAEESKATDEAMAAVVEEKKSMIAGASYPLEGLSVDPENYGVLFNGKPWTDLSTGEQLKISTSMAMSMNPDLRIIFLRNASLLDKNNLETIMTMATESDYQIWAEIVDSEDPTAIQFVDGAIEGQDPGAIEIEKPAPRTTRANTQFLETVDDNPFED